MLEIEIEKVQIYKTNSGLQTKYFCVERVDFLVVMLIGSRTAELKYDLASPWK